MEIIENIFYVFVVVFAAVVTILVVSALFETPAREERIKNKRFEATIKRHEEEKLQRNRKESELITN